MDVLLDTDPLAARLVTAIQTGDLDALSEGLAEHPDAARTGIGSAEHEDVRSLLHIATDWPGHFPRVAETIAVLAAAGADVNAPFQKSHAETPLHWAASSDDVAAIDALLDAGADIEQAGSALGGGACMANAVSFKQWNAARRLHERGARTNLFEAAALGLRAEVETSLAQPDAPPTRVHLAFWSACYGGHRDIAELALAAGADPTWCPEWYGEPAVKVAKDNGFATVAAWVRDLLSAR